jgi:hypothetical protein
MPGVPISQDDHAVTLNVLRPDHDEIHPPPTAES